AAVLGGTQSLHTNSLDETLALPTEEAARLALRTQQIIAHESGVADVIDPLGGSYYVESLTDQLEREAEALFAEIQSIGGVVKGIEDGWFQRQIARSAEQFQREAEQGKRIVVGVNEFTSEDDHPVEILKIANDAEQDQRRRLARLRAERDRSLVQEKLEALRSEEHTSELQSRGHLVCRLLLEKKKKKIKYEICIQTKCNKREISRFY